MPLQMQTTGGGSAGGVIDLYSPYMQQQQAEQQQQKANWDAVMNAFQQFAKMKAENDFLKQQGIVSQKPVMRTFDQNALNKYQGNMGNFSPEAQVQLQQMAQEKVNYPTGKTQPFFDQSKVPPGMKITIPGTGFEMTGQRQGMEIIPEGFEITGYNADGRPTVKKVKEEKSETYTEERRADIKSAAGRIKSGQSNYQTELKNILTAYPDISLDVLQNLKDIEKLHKPDIIKKRKEQRTKAIVELRSAGYPVTDNNIEAVIKQLENK